MRRFLISLFFVVMVCFAHTSEAQNAAPMVVPDDYKTIEEAYTNVKDGGTISIKPGKYELSKTLVVNRNVTFRGDTGNPEDVVIDCDVSNAFQITGGSPAFQNLTASSGAETCGGFFIMGGKPKISRCIVASRKGTGMYVYGKDADPKVEKCIMKDCAGPGVFVSKEGRGEFRDCEIYGNANSGIQVLESGNPTFTGCKIHDGKGGGVFVYEEGRGEFRDCDIYGNVLAGIAVQESGNPTFTGCKIHDGKAAGVLVLKEGLGIFRNCEIYGNAEEVIVKDPGKPMFTECKIQDGKDSSVKVTKENSKPAGAQGNVPVVVPDDYPTIEEAYANVKDGGIISIKTGKYELKKTLEIDRTVTFQSSSGNPEDVIIDYQNDSTIGISGGSPTFKNLTFSNGGENACFVISGDTPKILQCVITSAKGDGIRLGGPNANPLVEKCVIKDCAITGVTVMLDGRGEFRDCDIYGNVAGIVVIFSGNPTVTGCKIHDQKMGGAVVAQEGKGEFHDCDIYKNGKAGFGIGDSGNPTIIRCKFHGHEEAGMKVSSKGLGEIKDCEFYENKLVGIYVAESGDPTVTGCKIHNQNCGVLVTLGGLGKFTDCDIYYNMAGINVENSGNPTVAGCKIHDGVAGVIIKNGGKGTFNNNNNLSRNFFEGENLNWVIESEMGQVNNSSNW